MSLDTTEWARGDNPNHITRTRELTRVWCRGCECGMWVSDNERSILDGDEGRKVIGSTVIKTFVANTVHLSTLFSLSLLHEAFSNARLLNATRMIIAHYLFIVSSF